MLGQIFKLKSVAWYCIVPLVLFLLLKKFIDETVIHFFVKGIFLSCYPSNLRLDIATISLFIIAIIYLAIKRSRKAILGYKSIYLLVDYILIYLLYRFRILDNAIELTPFSFIQILKLLDSTAIVSFTAILLSLIPYAKEKSSSTEIEGFIIDEATKIDTENDLLNRSKFIREIANRIINTNSPNGSFPIGVIAAWGSGKTTFLNTLSSNLKESNQDIIRIEFNAWKCSTPSQVIETFFKQLKSQLGHFSFTFESKIQDYISNLIKGTKNEGFNGFKNILESIFPTPSIEKQYETINSEIKRIGKKIVVFIDDLDRLDKKEIYEVIRLIRNTANFSNTFYVVAYDRNYLLNAIEDINSYQAHQFLEKIFQIEFALPPISGTILQSEITKKVETFLSETDKEEYRSLLQSKISLYNSDSIFNLATLLISNIRDVVRFINSLKLNYQFVKGEVAFKDFYNLEIIRFKHPELFIEIYRNKGEILSYEKETNSQDSEYIYFLKNEKKDDGNDGNTLELETFLNNNSRIYKLSEKELILILRSYQSIFPYKKLNHYSDSKYPLLSVVRPSMHDRYFILGIEGRLSQLEFSQIRALSQTQMVEKLSDFIDRGLESEVIERLENIDSFDNREDFEKIVINIFHVANTKLQEKGYYAFGNYLGYNGNILSNLLNRSKVLEFYAGLSHYTDFLKSLLSTGQVRFTYTNQFLSSLLRDNFYSFENILTINEITDLSIKNLDNAASKSLKITKDLWWHFIYCTTRESNYLDSSSYTVSYPVVEPAKKIMQDFILKHDIDGLIRLSISPTPFGKNLKFENFIATVFDSNENFIASLKTTNTNSIYKEEFLRFYEDFETSELFKTQGIPPNYFKIIPITQQKWD